MSGRTIVPPRLMLYSLHDLVDQLKAPHQLRDLAAQLRDHADLSERNSSTRRQPKKMNTGKGCEPLKNLVIQQLVKSPYARRRRQPYTNSSSSTRALIRSDGLSGRVQLETRRPTSCAP